MKSSRCLASVLVLLTVFTLGCAVIDSHSETKISGQRVADDVLGAIEKDVTTEQQLVAMLGEPESVVNKGEGARDLIYRSKKVTQKRTALLFVLNTSSTNERVWTVSFTIRDGIVTAVQQKTTSRGVDVDF